MIELLYGKPVIENPKLLAIEHRTWKERLFTFKPWSPFVAVKYSPDTNVYQGVEAYYMHPVTAQRLRQEGLIKYEEFKFRHHYNGVVLRRSNIGVFGDVQV